MTNKMTLFKAFSISLLLLLILILGLNPVSAKTSSHSKAKKTSRTGPANRSDDSPISKAQYDELKKIMDEWNDEAKKIKESLNPDDDENDVSDLETDDAPNGNEDEAKKVGEFVDDATLDYLHDEEQQDSPFSNLETEKYRVCRGDLYNRSANTYEEDVSDECLLPKFSIAARLFNVRYSLAKCIFEKENPDRDRLAHNNNGNGLAQIVNKTMKEISNRWSKDDSLAVTLRQCLQLISNRDEKYRVNLENLKVLSRFRKSVILKEATYSPPNDSLNPLYRDDAICMGLMTMAIKVEEAKYSRSGNMSDQEIARRYNATSAGRRYARDILSCMQRQPPAEKKRGGIFGNIKLPDFSRFSPFSFKSKK